MSEGPGVYYLPVLALGFSELRRPRRASPR